MQPNQHTQLSHQQLLQLYVEEMRAVRARALAWWQGLIAAEETDLGNATHAVRLRWPVGPASHPEVIAVYRRYYLKIDALNEAISSAWEAQKRGAEGGEKGWILDEGEEEQKIVQPHKLLLDSLDRVDPELSKFMMAFLFSPIGIDPEGNFN